MTGAQLVHAMREYDELKKKLGPVTTGFGVKGLTVTIALKNGEKFEFIEFEAAKRDDLEQPYLVRGIGKLPSEKDKPERWFSTHFDHEIIAWIEFETFPDR